MYTRISSVALAAHVPATHETPLAQACPHAPQLAGSLCSLTHLPLQPDSPAEQQVELEQVCPAPHAVAQVPQCEPFDVRSTHCPLHMACPPEHAATHLLWTQRWSAPQTCPQAPQLYRSTSRCTHAPSHTVAVVFAHAGAQRPAEQIWPVAHAAPQRPQFCLSALRSTHSSRHITSPRPHICTGGGCTHQGRYALKGTMWGGFGCGFGRGVAAATTTASMADDTRPTRTSIFIELRFIDPPG
jgi:hypothetical protein